MVRSSTQLKRITFDKELVQTWGLFFLCPVFGVIAAWPKAIRNKYNYIYILGTLFALFGAFFPPLSDAYRYRWEYLHTTDFSLNFSELFVTKKDFLFNYLSWIFNGLGVSYEGFKLIILTACYWMYAWMFIDIVKHSVVLEKNRRLYIVGMISVLFLIRLFTLVSGIRFGIASTIVIVAMYQLFRKHYTAGFILLVSAIAMHFSMLIFIPCIIGAYCLRHLTLSRSLKFSVLLILIIFSYSSIGTLLTNLASFSELASAVNNAYIKGNWGTEALLKSASVGGLIFTVLRIIPVIPLAWFEIDRNNDFLHSLGFMLLVILCISFSSYTVLLRYSNVATAILCISQLVNLKNDKLSLRKLKITCVSLIMVFLVYVYSQRKALTECYYEYEAITCPAMLLLHDEYTDIWVRENVDFKGELR